MKFEFTSDNLALDFAGTRMYRETAPAEQLTEPECLAEWVRAARLVDRGTPVDRGGFASALELREAIYRAARAVVNGSECTEGDRRVLNRFATAPPVRIRLVRAGSQARSGDLGSVLSTISRSAIDLLGGEDHTRLRGCPGTGCTRLFVDRSRAGTRRWCGMATCGSRAKVAAYRQRKRAESS
ncbi:CGNR zinc finger domain-containing protein [Amycolatopsis samaneae]|uniref:CGNR zinc finger domain-containing protein n=1 Tax=Amycolatopsis samaneae TaxID=664691 RepID=A0ABW5GA17_9PSEU